MKLSPITLFYESVNVLLVPGARTFEQVFTSGGVVPQSALTVEQSLLIIWPCLVALLALMVVCFAASYIKFMREEIRST